MSTIMVVGAARDAKTRFLRTQAGARAKRRRIRLGGVYRIRPNRSLALTSEQVAEHKEELEELLKAGLVFLQDGDGRPLELEAVLGTAPPAPPPKKEEAPKESAPADTEESTDTSEEITSPGIPTPVVDEDKVADVDYAGMSYADLKARVRKRELEPETWSKADLIAVLTKADEAAET